MEVGLFIELLTKQQVSLYNLLKSCYLYKPNKKNKEKMAYIWGTKNTNLAAHVEFLMLVFFNLDYNFIYFSPQFEKSGLLLIESMGMGV